MWFWEKNLLSTEKTLKIVFFFQSCIIHYMFKHLKTKPIQNSDWCDWMHRPFPRVRLHWKIDYISVTVKREKKLSRLCRGIKCEGGLLFLFWVCWSNIDCSTLVKYPILHCEYWVHRKRKETTRRDEIRWLRPSLTKVSLILTPYSATAIKQNALIVNSNLPARFLFLFVFCFLQF